MPVDSTGTVPAQGQPAAQVTPERPPVSDQDKKYAKDYLDRIKVAQDRPAVKEAVKTFERNRKLLRGIDPSDNNKKMRSNLHFANLAAMRPQVYAKDPEYSVKPMPGVPDGQMDAVKKLAATSETLLTVELVKGCSLKRRAKRILTSTFATSVGWWKAGYQEDKKTDPLIQNQLKDTQDELMRLQTLRDQLHDPQTRADNDLQMAKLNATLAGLQSNSEVSVARGLVLDFTLAEDITILDPSVRELGDYLRANAIAQRVWMTRDAYRSWTGYDAKKGKVYSEQAAGLAPSTAGNAAKGDDLLCVHEVWDQQTSQVVHVCEGEEGFCVPPTSPDWTGQRWYPFFLLMFNETDGDMFPLSDIELTEPLVREYNEARDDLVQDRRDTRPFTVVRKGGSLTPKDVENIRNRKGNDIVLIEGVGNAPISNDIAPITLGTIKPENYNTQPARADMEQILGGGDAARGSVLEAKTATEAEILSQGLRGRSAERQDIMEDLLTELGTYAMQIMLRKYTEAEVQRICGADARWPQASSVEEVFRMVTLDVRGGSTGKPDRLQDQDRWTKLLPVIEKTIEQVSELRSKGQGQLAQALIELTRETLRRFDERLDIEQFLPPADEKAGVDPQMLAQQVEQLKQQVSDQQTELTKAQNDQLKTVFTAATTIATAANPLIALQAFQQALGIVQADLQQGQEMQQGAQGAPTDGAPSPIAQAALAAAQQPGGAPPDAMPPIPQGPPQSEPPDQPQPQ